MTDDARLLLVALVAIVTLIVLIARFRLHPFIALVGVSVATGLAAGLPALDTVKAFQDGVGNALAFIAVVVGLGTMLGKIMAESGAAARIAITLVDRFGERRVHWAMMLVAIVVGIPVFFQVGFVLLIPIVFTVARRTGVSIVKIGISLLVGLSVVHGMLPPHPAAMLAVGAYKADVGRTILLGLLVGLPTAAIAGPLYANWISRRVVIARDNPLAAQLEGSTPAIMPSFANAMLTVLLPVILMLLPGAADLVLPAQSAVRGTLHFIGSPIVALLIALLVSFWSLGRVHGFTAEQLLKFCNDCLGPTAAIMLVIGAGGGFNQVLIASGVGRAIAGAARVSHASPLLLAWTLAALIRIATGSATVAMTTAAGIVAPIVAAMPGTNAELMVLATGAGSLVLSHVNDAGFWLVKEYFNMTVPETLKTWTVAETLIAVAGLTFILMLSLVL
jgi:gluconate:H+ symporter, GntP family